MFCDKVIIKVKAGNGGDGVVSFLHEKFREFGGPDGGDGGRGGNIVFRPSENTSTLYWFKTHHDLRAEDGERGKKRRSHGKNGQDLVLKVPFGTIIRLEDTGEVLADLSSDSNIVVAKGGDGGFGNAHFTSSTRQAPRVAELGEPGEELSLILELKMIADVGLVGLPNVGKSTLLSVISAARPKIANYEFTTIIPNLGVVEEGKMGVEKGFIVADIPGLIEGASEGKGLGDEFLRHIERTRVLIHVIDATHNDLVQDYKTILDELRYYDVDLSKKPQIVAVNKIEVIKEGDLSIKISKLEKVVQKGQKIFPISAVTHKNLKELMYETQRILSLTPNASLLPKGEPVKTFTIEDVVGHNLFEVTKKKNKYVVTGPKIEKFAIRTDFANPYAILRLRDILKKTGIDKELKRHGAIEGSTVEISGKKFVL